MTGYIYIFFFRKTSDLRWFRYLVWKLHQHSAWIAVIIGMMGSHAQESSSGFWCGLKIQSLLRWNNDSQKMGRYFCCALVSVDSLWKVFPSICPSHILQYTSCLSRLLPLMGPLSGLRVHVRACVCVCVCMPSSQCASRVEGVYVRHWIINDPRASFNCLQLACTQLKPWLCVRAHAPVCVCAVYVCICSQDTNLLKCK